MAQYNSLHSTPVRRDELLITRKSLRSQVLVSTNLYKGSKNYVEKKENKRLNRSQVLSSTKIGETLSFISSKVGTKFDIWILAYFTAYNLTTYRN